MHRIQIGPTEHRLKNTWEEVSAELLFRLLPHIYDTDRAAARSAGLPLLSDIPPLTLMQLKPYQYAALAELTNWIWEKPLTLPIVPHFEHKGQKWLLPRECLYGSPFIEYDHLDNLAQNLSGNDPQTLHRLLACIARPEGPDGKRLPFDGLQLDSWADQLADLPEHLKAYLLLFATGCLRQIREDYAPLWEEDKDAPVTDSRYDLNPDVSMDFSWTGVAFQLAEQGTFGTYEQVIFTDCHTVLYYLMWKGEEGTV